VQPAFFTARPGEPVRHPLPASLALAAGLSQQRSDQRLPGTIRSLKTEKAIQPIRDTHHVIGVVEVKLPALAHSAVFAERDACANASPTPFPA